MSIENPTPKRELPPEQKLTVAIKELSDAMFENIEAGKAELDAKVRKQKAHYTLSKAKDRLYSLERELIS